MSYKDKEKQKAAQRERTRRYRNRQVVTPLADVTPSDVTPSVTPSGKMTPEGLKSQVPANYGQSDCQCFHCQQNRRSDHQLILNHGAYKTAEQLNHGEINRVSLPGDIDYEGICKEGICKSDVKPSEGLPADVKDEIDRLCAYFGPDDIRGNKAERTRRAIQYQHSFTSTLQSGYTNRITTAGNPIYES